MIPGYRILEHPADVGIEASGATQADAYRAAAEGLLALIVDPATVRARFRRHVAVDAADPGQLLVRWLSELLYLFDGERFVTSRCAALAMTAAGLEADLEGEPLAPDRHALRTDVKAVTYHRLSVEHSHDGWSVTCFFDV